MLVFEGVWQNPESIGVPEALLISLIAIIIVFATLTIIILATTLFQKGLTFAEKKMSIMPRPENSILSSDEDAVVAVLVATIDFHRTTGKEPRVKSITQIEE